MVVVVVRWWCGGGVVVVLVLRWCYGGGCGGVVVVVVVVAPVVVVAVCNLVKLGDKRSDSRKWHTVSGSRNLEPDDSGLTCFWAWSLTCFKRRKQHVLVTPSAGLLLPATPVRGLAKAMHPAGPSEEAQAVAWPPQT